MAARRGRPRKFREKGGPLYEEGTPIDEATGAPPEEALIPEDQARNMAFDAESSRMNAQHQTVLKNKQQGKPMAQWSPDPRIKYGEIYRFHPTGKVVIRMIEPYDDDNIPTRYLSQLSNYDKLIQHIKDTHWQGKQATYKWVIMEDGGRVWGTGVIKFGPQREESPQQQQPMYGGQPMMGGQPQWYGQQWGYPPPQQVYPQQQYPMQSAPFVEPAQHQPVQQPAPVQAPSQPQYTPHPDVLTGLLAHIERLTSTVIEQKMQAPNAPHFVQGPPQAPPPAAPPGYIAQIPWSMMGQLPPQVVAQIPAHLLPYIFGNGYVPVPQQQPQAQSAPAQPPAQQPVPQAPPLSPIDAAREAMAGVKEMMRMGQEFAQFASPGSDEPETAVPPPDPDPTPLQVQDIGFTRFVRDRDTGQMVETGGLDKILMSGDKLGAVLETVIDKGINVIDKRQKMITEHQLHEIDRAKQLASLQREIAESQERIAKAKAIQAAADSSMRASQTLAVPQQPQFASPPQPPPQQQVQAAPPQQQFVHAPPQQPPPQHVAPPQPQFIAAPPWATVNSSPPPVAAPPVQTEPSPPPLAIWPPTVTEPVPPPEPVKEDEEPEPVVMRPIIFVRAPTPPQNGTEEKKEEVVEEPPPPEPTPLQEDVQ